MELLISKIKEKKSLKNLDDKIVEETIKKYLTNSADTKNPKSKSFKKVVKESRNELNRIYGCFILKDNLTLEAHSSTKERKNIYKTLYEDLFKITGKPKSILDLAAGLNPLTYEYLTCKPKYIATELTKKDTNNLNTFFKKHKINGKAIQQDLTKENIFPKTDIAFLFKILDLLTKKQTEYIVTNLKSEYIIISFSTTTLKNIKMNYPRRGWLEKMLKRLNLSYKKLTYNNEMFYIIKN